MEELWCGHILGPDDVHAAPSKVEAEERCVVLNDFLAKHAPTPEQDPHGNSPTVSAVVAPWPWDAEGHKQGLRNWNGAW